MLGQTTNPNQAATATTNTNSTNHNNSSNSTIAHKCYTTNGGIKILREAVSLSYMDGAKSITDSLDHRLGLMLESNFEYPGKYTRFDIGFVNPPLQIVANLNKFTITALNARGKVILALLAEKILKLNFVVCRSLNDSLFEGSINYLNQIVSEELRSKQPSIFSIIRLIVDLFFSTEDDYLGLYGAFGYDLAYQFEKMPLKLTRESTQRDIVLYLPDQLIVVDHRKELTTQYSYDYEFAIDNLVAKENSKSSTTKALLANAATTTKGLVRDGVFTQYTPKQACKISSDHHEGEYVGIVNKAKEYFKRGDLFEVVPGQTFFANCNSYPSEVFAKLRARNPSPYGFFMNLGDNEYLVGASPEMYVRVTGKRVETCPISGTIVRGKDAFEDADNILKLLNSAKDESELTMCTDVDRNDKSRICEPGSVKVIGRRQLELYSRLIHTVDHVEGTLRSEYDALDAFLTHIWAVTVTGAPKKWAMQFLEEHEKSPRNWYGGAIGYVGFNGNMNTGLTIRTVRIKDEVAQVRVGATLLYDSIAKDEEEETVLKASALLNALGVSATHDEQVPNKVIPINKAAKTAKSKKKALLVDHQDSFVHTLANYFRQNDMEVVTLRSGFSLQLVEEMAPDLVVLSPGPGRPSDFNIAATIDMCIKLGIPIFGVCLGLQAIVEYFGGTLALLDYPMHGKKATINSYSGNILADLKDKQLQVGLYHSLYANQDTLPAELTVTAISSFGIIMAIEHKNLPIWAVQFHPESLLSMGNDAGLKIIKNVVSLL